MLPYVSSAGDGDKMPLDGWLRLQEINQSVPAVGAEFRKGLNGAAYPGKAQPWVDRNTLLKFLQRPCLFVSVYGGPY